VYYAEFAKLLPNTTRTIYPLLRYYGGTSKIDRGLAMEFVYVDPTVEHAFTVIQVEQATVTTTNHYGYYCLVPLTVPADIVTSPYQLFWYLVFRYGNWKT